jgi:hypothetical protein
MIRLWCLFAVIALASSLLAAFASAQVLASEQSLVGNYICVVDASTALVYGDDKQDHAIVPTLSAEEKTFFMSIERNGFSSDPATCAPRDADSAFMCHAQFKMTIKEPLYYFWSDGYQFHDIAGGAVIQMHNDASFTWAEPNARDFTGSLLREGRCNRITR